MYTKLPPDKIKEGVVKAVRKAFQLYAPDSAAAFSLKWTNDGDAKAVFDDKRTYMADSITTPWDAEYPSALPQLPEAVILEGSRVRRDGMPVEEQGVLCSES